MDEAALRAMLPMGFGQQPSASVKGGAGRTWAPTVPEEQADVVEAPQKDARLPLDATAQPPAQDLAKESTPRHDPAALGVGRTHEYAGLPMEHSIELQDHSKTISALALDPTGTRVATGSHDYEVKLWDFGGMTQAFRPFRAWEPAENYPVVDLAYSPVSRNLLCISATTQPRVYDYQGDEVATYRKGDVFMRDMKHTTGHITELSCGTWHPTDAATFLTAGTDSTVRLWDVGFTASQKLVIIVRSKERGTKTKVTAAAYTPDAKAIVAACQDGALHVWSTSGSFSRPSASLERAHTKDAGATSIAVASDNVTMATRGYDDTVKLWDLRHLRKPVGVQDKVPCGSEHADILFSPDGQHIVTGTASVPRAPNGATALDAPKDVQSDWGQVAVYSRTDLAQELVYPVEKASVTRLAWHPRLNQVLAATRSGVVHVYYDDEASQLGAKLGVKRRAKVRSNPFGIEQLPGGVTADVPIFMPDDEDEVEGAQKKEAPGAARRDPKKTKLPEMPIRGAGRGGRIGISETTHLVKDMYLDQAALRMQDPREALLKYAEKAEKDPRWTNAYHKTQPKTLFSKDSDDES